MKYSVIWYMKQQAVSVLKYNSISPKLDCTDMYRISQ